MLVIIDKKEFEYQSDYPEGWKFSAGDPFKFPVGIGDQACFIKRFEQKNPKNISGWDLLLKISGKTEPNLSKIFDIKKVEEKGKDIYYIFFEYLDGLTLDKNVRSGEINLSVLNSNLFNAIRSLQKYDFWFADFCEKNIFCRKDGTFVLVDVDSTQKITDEPDNEMYGSKDYWILVFKFYKEILNRTDIKLSDINGISFNFLQIVFLVFRLKLFLQGNKKDYNSTELYNQLHYRLNEAVPEMKEIFLKILKNRNQTLSEDEVIKLENLVDEKIIKANRLKETLMDVDNLPIIKQFTSNKTEIERGEEFILSWQVENANKLELHKNGAMYRPIEAGKTSINLAGFADGTQQQSSYQIVAYNDLTMTKSDAVFVRLKQQEKKPPVIKKRTAIIGGVSVFLLSIFLVFMLTKKRKIDAYVKQEFLWQGIDTTLTLIGRDLSLNEGLTVILNDDSAKIIESFTDSLHVLIPKKKITTDLSDSVRVFISSKKVKGNFIGSFALYPPVYTKVKLIRQNSNITFYGKNLNSNVIRVFLDNNEIPVLSRNQDSLVASIGSLPGNYLVRKVNITIRYDTKVIFNNYLLTRKIVVDPPHHHINPHVFVPVINH